MASACGPVAYPCLCVWGALEVLTAPSWLGWAARATAPVTVLVRALVMLLGVVLVTGVARVLAIAPGAVVLARFVVASPVVLALGRRRVL